MPARSVIICRMHRRDLDIALSYGRGDRKHSSINPFDIQINGASHFSNDLGLDSLDTVEVVMAIEEVRAQFPSEKHQLYDGYLTVSTGVQH